MKLPKSFRADLALLLAALIWGSSFGLVKKSLAQISPILFLALRFWVATAVTAIVLRKSVRDIKLVAVKRGALLAALFSGGYVFQTVGLRGTSASKSAFLSSLTVLLVPLLGYAIFRRRPAWRTLAGVLIATAGIGLLTLTSWDFRFRYGETLTLVCALVFALHILYLGRYAPTSDIRQLVLLQLALCAMFFTIAGAVLETAFLVWDSDFFFYLVFTSVLSTAVAFYLQNRAQQLTTANRTALILSLIPLFAALFDYLLVARTMTGKEWLGGGLVVAGILFSELRR